MRTFLFSIALLAAAFTAPAAQLGSEIAVSTPQYGPAPGDQTTSLVATDGSDFLVAWIDDRGYPAEIYANRVTHDGRVLDGTGVRVPIDQPWQNAQVIGLHYIDGAYTLVYTYSGGPPLLFQTAIAVISADGRLIEGPRVILDQQAVLQSASNGSRIVFPTAAHEFVAIDGRGTILGRYPSDSTGTAIASNGRTFLAFGYSPAGTTYTYNLIGLDESGKPVDESPVVISGAPVIASDGTDYLAVFNGPSAATAVRVDAHARIQSTRNTARYDALAWTDGSYVGVALTADQGEAFLITVDRDGAPQVAPQALGAGTPGRFNRPAAASNGNAVLLTWMTGSTDATFGLDIAGAMADAGGTLRLPVLAIPSAGNAQRNVAGTSSGSQDFVAWGEPGGVFATRIAADARALDGRGIAVANETMSSFGYLAGSGLKDVRAIDDGSEYIVAWGSNRTWGKDGLLNGPVKAQRIAYSGALIGATIELSPCSRTFDLAMGTDAPVVFHTPCTGDGLVAQRVGVDGPVGTPVVISTMSGADFPRASWNGSEWLVVWNNLIKSGLLIYPPMFQGEVYATRLSGTLAPLDPQPLSISVSQTSDAKQPLVATDGRDFLAAWTLATFDGTSGAYARTLHADGSMTEPALLVQGALETKSMVWTGRRYAVAFAKSGDLFLTHAGERDEVVVSATTTGELDAALIAPPARPMRVVYTRVAPEPAYGGVPRAFVRDEIPPKRRSVR